RGRAQGRDGQARAVARGEHRPDPPGQRADGAGRLADPRDPHAALGSRHLLGATLSGVELRREDVLRALERVIDPELGRPVTELDMVRDVRIEGGDVAVVIALTVA